MNVSGDISFRNLSCACTSRTQEKYEDCNRDMFCGNWVQTTFSAYPSYDQYEVYSDDDSVTE